MNCIILYRVNGGPAEAVMEHMADDDTYRIREYLNFDEAVAFADANKLFQSGQADYQIIELDEL